MEVGWKDYEMPVASQYGGMPAFDLRPILNPLDEVIEVKIDGIGLPFPENEISEVRPDWADWILSKYAPQGLVDMRAPEGGLRNRREATLEGLGARLDELNKGLDRAESAIRDDQRKSNSERVAPWIMAPKIQKLREIKQVEALLDALEVADPLPEKARLVVTPAQVADAYKTYGTKSGTAKALGITPQTVAKKLKQYVPPSDIPEEI